MTNFICDYNQSACLHCVFLGLLKAQGTKAGVTMHLKLDNRISEYRKCREGDSFYLWRWSLCQFLAEK